MSESRVLLGLVLPAQIPLRVSLGAPDLYMFCYVLLHLICAAEAVGMSA